MLHPISKYVTAAALAVGTTCFVGCDQDDSKTVKTETRTVETRTNTTGPTTVRVDGPDGTPVRDATNSVMDKTKDAGHTVADKTKDAARSVGDAVKTGAEKVSTAVKSVAGSTARIQSTLAETTEAALTNDGFDDLVERLVDADRNRIGQTKLTDDQEKTLNGLVEQISKDWQAKYNSKFDIENVDALYNASFLTVMESEVGKADTSKDVAVNETVAGAPATKTENATTDQLKDKNIDSNLNDPGRNIATATIMASHGLPELKVPLVHELTGWKIDAPDTVTGDKLYKNLLDHLTGVKNMKAQWPATADEGYRAVTHHVLMAVLDKPM